MDEIVNRVANSALKVFDLEDLYPNGIRSVIDLSAWLEDGFLLKETDFRNKLKVVDWSQYHDHYVAISCSTDAIVPAWASILVTMYLAPFAKKVIFGSVGDLDTILYDEILNNINYNDFADQAVIIKGCARKPVPLSAYLLAATHLQPVAKSIMYGEACSAVPLYKARKQ